MAHDPRPTPRPPWRPHARHALALLCCLGLAAADARAGDTASLSSAQVFQLALEAQTAADYTPMMALLRQAAQAGHLPAQEMLAQALLAGPALYGSRVAADRCEAAAWAWRAASQGSAIGRQQWLLLGRTRAAAGACG